jgi:uncharacterized protein YabE (DUF348 family)
MTRKRLFTLAAVLAIAGLILIARGSRKSLTLIINGEQEQIETLSWTVSGLLSEIEISLNEEDFLNPSLSTWLWGGETISIETARWITIFADGESIPLITYEHLPAKILSQSGIRIYPGDRLLINGKPGHTNADLTPGENQSLQILRANPITVNLDGNQERLSSGKATLGEALWENGLQVRTGDRLFPPANTPLEGPINVNLSSAQDIHIQFDGGFIKSRSAAANIAEALQEARIPLQGLDFSKPGLEERIPLNGEIQVVRVKEDLFLESDPIPFETTTEPVADLEIDNRKVVQRGVYGLNTKRIRIRYEDEVEVSRQIEAEYISQEPASEIIGYGTKIVPKTLETPSGPIQYWRALEMYAISYNVTSSGGDGITATGLPLEKGIAAIDPRYIPYGTRMYIPGYGQALAADTGGGIKGRMIDLGYRDEDYVSWHQWVTVYFLWPPPEIVAWIIP